MTQCSKQHNLFMAENNKEVKWSHLIVFLLGAGNYPSYLSSALSQCRCTGMDIWFSRYGYCRQCISQNVVMLKESLSHLEIREINANRPDKMSDWFLNSWCKKRPYRRVVFRFAGLSSALLLLDLFIDLILMNRNYFLALEFKSWDGCLAHTG